MVSRLSQWEEFTEFLIEAGMVSREEMSVDAVKKYYASTQTLFEYIIFTITNLGGIMTMMIQYI